MKLIVTEFYTLDGVMEAPNEWSFPYWGDDIAKFKLDELMAANVQLLGRITYQGFASAWPSMTDEAGFADKMNNMPKYVVSTTLEKAEWTNSHIIKDNVVAEINKLREQPGGDILTAGSANLIQTLALHDLVDEYRLLTYPIVVGKGIRLFQEGTHTKLKLVESRPMESGVVLLRYQPDRK